MEPLLNQGLEQAVKEHDAPAMLLDLGGHDLSCGVGTVAGRVTEAAPLELGQLGGPRPEERTTKRPRLVFGEIQLDPGHGYRSRSRGGRSGVIDASTAGST